VVSHVECRGSEGLGRPWSAHRRGRTSKGGIPTDPGGKRCWA
jgi:hypothetical protein